MPKFIGFSTANADKVRRLQIGNGVDGGAGSITNPIIYGRKFRLVDSELVVQDLINALNISQGSIPGKPQYGTTIWSFVFEPNTLDSRLQIEAEIRRLIGQDPRLLVNAVNAYPQESGILIEVEVAVTPFNNPEVLSILFDQGSNTARRV